MLDDSDRRLLRHLQADPAQPIGQLAEAARLPLATAYKRLDRLRAAAEDSLAHADFWDRVASRRMIVDFAEQQVAATRDALNHGEDAKLWLETRPGSRAALLETLRGFGRGQTWSFSRFALASDAIRRFLAL